ncbi:hypothetical protein DSO57_1030202 [Entomophthora muscae]|uniref:Uncharacterized protein n=1 Tax=Entomophthora muscae TaxID=34485 RepID=A0ACC2S2U8_9FUNG|nr:hypothetical protein DSO57_1030202 [Entomophthora muscae]
MSNLNEALDGDVIVRSSFRSNVDCRVKIRYIARSWLEGGERLCLALELASLFENGIGCGSDIFKDVI